MLSYSSFQPRINLVIGEDGVNRIEATYSFAGDRFKVQNMFAMNIAIFYHLSFTLLFNSKGPFTPRISINAMTTLQ